jgi:radical SAM-linked protein
MWYSEGFNPQPKIVFAVPLPVGVESNCEYMDIKLNSFMELDDIKERLNKNFPEEMEVLDVYIPEQKFKNIAYIDYEIVIHSNKVDELTPKLLQNVFVGDIFLVKKSKGAEKEINIKDYINSISFELCTESSVKIKAILSAGNEKNLNPELVVEAIRKNTDLLNGSPIEQYYSVFREKMLCEDLTVFQ